MAVEWRLAFIIFSVCGFLENRPETLPPLVDQRVTASKPVDHVFGRIIRPPKQPQVQPFPCAPRASQPLRAATIMRLRNQGL